MNDMTISGFGQDGQPQTMSSREIAELTGKRHDNVMRDARAMLVELYGERDLLKFEGVYQGGNREQRPCFNLPKRETLILVSGYNITMRAKIIDRWQELEAAASDPRRALADPSALRHLLLENVEKVIALQGEVEEMRPQVQALERIAVSEGSMCITDAAKTLQVQPRALFAYLREHHWIYRRPNSASDIAYQDKLQSGVLEHKVTVGTRADGSEKTTTQVRVTPKGLTRLGKLFPPPAQAA